MRSGDCIGGRRGNVILDRCGVRRSGLGQGLFPGESAEGGDVVLLCCDHTDGLAAVDALSTGRGQDFSNVAVVLDFITDGRFVGLDLSDDVTGGDLVALLKVPLEDLALVVSLSLRPSSSARERALSAPHVPGT